MITLGSNVSSITGLLDRLQIRVQSEGIAQIAVLDSGDATNLKNVLRILIRTITTNSECEDADSGLNSGRLV